MNDDVCQAHSGLISEIANLKQSDTALWEAVKKIQNRPPVWMLLSSCIAVMWSFLSGVFLIGVLLSA